MKFIVGLDPGERDDTPLRWACTLSRALGASVEVVHALQYEPPSDRGLGVQHADRMALSDELLMQHCTRVREAISAELPGAGDLPISIAVGKAHVELAAYAKEFTDGVVVVGPGRRRWIRGLLGTTADRLLRMCDSPVLVVRGEVRERVERILAPVDFSAVSKNAAATAVRWGAALGCEITLFHVPQIEFYSSVEAGAGAHGIEVARVEPELTTVEHARLGLAALIEELKPPGLRMRREIGRYAAPPADAIVARLAEDNVDLVVMGTHGRTGLERGLLGSVAESVIHRVQVPVLVVPQAR